MDCSTPGFPVHHYLWEFAQTPLHRVKDAIQPSPPLLPSSPPALTFSQHQSLFQSVGSSHQVAKVLELQLQHQSFQDIQGWFPLRLTGLISLQSKGFSRVFSSTSVWKHQFFGSAFVMVQLSQPHMITGNTIALTIQVFAGKVMSLLLNTLSRFIIAFLPRNKHLLISRLRSPSIVILEPKKIKSVTVSIFSPFICCEVMGLEAMILVFWMLSFKPAFSLSPFTFVSRRWWGCSIVRLSRWRGSRDSQLSVPQRPHQWFPKARMFGCQISSQAAYFQLTVQCLVWGTCLQVLTNNTWMYIEFDKCSGCSVTF